MSEKVKQALKFEKIKVYRNSGRPVDEADDERYMTEWREFFDKAMASRAGGDNLLMSRYLSFGAHMLQKKHYKPTYVSTPQELAELHMSVGVPLLIGVDGSTLELIAVIQDSSGN